MELKDALPHVDIATLRSRLEQGEVYFVKPNAGKYAVLNRDESLAILDRLSPLEPEQPDEATVWAKKVFNKAGYFFTPGHSKIAEAAGVLSELIASKDAETRHSLGLLQGQFEQAIDQRDTALAERAALRVEIERLKRLFSAAERAIGDHHAPNDCYATGPLTGDKYRDLVECPACAFFALRAELKAAERNPAEPEKNLPDLIVTKGGVPFEDQAEGIRQFKAACLANSKSADTAPVVEVTQVDIDAANHWIDAYAKDEVNLETASIADMLVRHRAEAEARGRTEGRREALGEVIAKIGSMKTGRSQPIVMTCAGIVDELKRLITEVK